MQYTDFVKKQIICNFHLKILIFLIVENIDISNISPRRF